MYSVSQQTKIFLFLKVSPSFKIKVNLQYLILKIQVKASETSQ